MPLGNNAIVDLATGQVSYVPATADQQARSDANGAAQQQAAQTDSAIRQWAITTAQSTVGLSVAALTLAQIKAMLVWMAYAHGMVDQNGVVTPTQQWH